MGLIIASLGAPSQDSLLGSSSCGQLAGQAAYLWFLKPAARQDVALHSRPPSGSVWESACVNVLGGVHHGAGNAPRYHNGKCERLHNGTFLFLHLILNSSPPPPLT